MSAHGNKVRSLEAELDRCKSELASILGKRDDERRDLLAAETRRIDALMEERYGQQITATANAVGLARAALDAARVEAAQSKADELPQGTLVEWNNQPITKWSRHYKFSRTGRRGKIEIVTGESQFAANLHGYSCPKLGDVIVRVLKKDGTASSKFVRWPCNVNWGPQWQSEDWMPSEQEDA